MDDNVYTPPTAELREIIHRKPRPKTAIAAAITFDLLLSILIPLLIGAGYGAYLGIRGYALEEIQVAAMALQANTAFRNTIVLFGGLVSVGAGYLCARLAVRHVYRTTLLAVLLLMLIVRLLKFNQDFTLRELGLTAVSFAAYLLGAWLYQRKTAGSGAGENDAI